MYQHRTIFSTIVFCLSLSVSACGSSGYAGSDDPPPDEIEGLGPDGSIGDSGTASLRVVHASATAPAVDIYVRGIAEPVITDLAYGDLTDYLQVAAGDYTVDIRAAGAAGDSTPAYSADLSLASGDIHSVLAVGLLGGDAASAFRLIALDDDLPLPGFGHSRIRVVHAGADAPSVALDLENDGTIDLEGLARFGTSDSIDIPAGTRLQVGILAGNPLADVTSFTTPPFPDKGMVTIVATGLLGKNDDAGFSLFAFSDIGVRDLIRQNPRVYALHASPDAPAVDIGAGGTRLVRNLSFGQLSAPIQVPAGSYDLDFYAAGTDIIAATQATPKLVAGETYMAIAGGFLAGTGAQAFRLIAVADDFGTSASQALVRVVHASPDAPPVDVGPLYGPVVHPVLFENVAYGSSSEGTGIAVTPGPVDLGVAASGAFEAVADFTVDPRGGQHLFAVAAGALTPVHPQQGFRILAVDASTWPWTVATVLPN